MLLITINQLKPPCKNNKGNELVFRLRHLEGANIEAERNYSRPTASSRCGVRRKFLSLALFAAARDADWKIVSRAQHSYGEMLPWVYIYVHTYSGQVRKCFRSNYKSVVFCTLYIFGSARAHTHSSERDIGMWSIAMLRARAAWLLLSDKDAARVRSVGYWQLMDGTKAQTLAGGISCDSSTDVLSEIKLNP
jgi:hypothetical protein